MVCSPGQPCYSLAGKVIKGRSVPGYDYISQPQSLGSGPKKSGVMVMNGAVHNPSGRPYGTPKTPAERMATHYATYGNTNLPPRGTGIQNLGTQSLDIDWGQVFGGFMIGLVFSIFVFTATGRKIAYRTGQSIAGRL